MYDDNIIVIYKKQVLQNKKFGEIKPHKLHKECVGSTLISSVRMVAKLKTRLDIHFPSAFATWWVTINQHNSN